MPLTIAEEARRFEGMLGFEAIRPQVQPGVLRVEATVGSPIRGGDSSTTGQNESQESMGFEMPVAGTPAGLRRPVIRAFDYRDSSSGMVLASVSTASHGRHRAPDLEAVSQPARLDALGKSMRRRQEFGARFRNLLNRVPGRRKPVLSPA